VTGCSDPRATPTAGNIFYKIFNGNAVKGRQQSSLNLCSVIKTPPFQILLCPWEQKKVQEVGWVSRGVGHNHFVFSQKGGVLLMLQRFNENRWQPLTAFLLKIFRHCFQQWEWRWDCCIQSQVEYFEED
jgi:hypothetical protein